MSVGDGQDQSHATDDQRAAGGVAGAGAPATSRRGSRRWWLAVGAMYLLSVIGYEAFQWLYLPRTYYGAVMLPGASIVGLLSDLFVVALGVAAVIAAAVTAPTNGRRAGGIVLASVALVTSLLPVALSATRGELLDGVIAFPPLATTGLDMGSTVLSLVWMTTLFLSWALTWPIRGVGYLGILLIVLSVAIGHFTMFFYGAPLLTLAVHSLLLVVLPGGAIAIALLGDRGAQRRAAARAAQPLAAAAPGPAAVPHTNTMAVLGLVFAFVFSILGVVFSHVALSQISRTRESGRGLAIAGLAVGYTSIALGLAVIIWQLLLLQSILSMY